MEQTGATLSMHSNSVFKGGVTHNGILLKIHENAYTIGYSALRSPDGTTAGSVNFGDGVFLDASQKNNHAYVGAPTVTGAVPVFGGIVVREPAIASGYPVNNGKVQSFQKGLLCREGYIEYKKGKVVVSSSIVKTNVELFDWVYPNYCMWCDATNGQVYFTPKSTVYENSADLLVGRVASINPDDRTITVYVSVGLLADTAQVSGRTPTIAVTSASVTNTEIPYVVTVGIPSVMVLEHKTHSGDTWTLDGTVEAVYDPDNTNYKVSYKIEGLTKNTAYDIRATAINANGATADTEESVTTANT